MTLSNLAPLCFCMALLSCTGGSPGSGGGSGDCGNAMVEPPEECDLGRLNDDAGSCKADCTAQRCGDGFIGPDEACDDGNDVAGDGCEPDCMETDYCGNGLPDPGEVCDDGDKVDTDGCLADCTAAVCGDEIVRTDLTDPAAVGYEACDDGNRNSDFAADACRTDCTLPRCGDGVTDTAESCDDGGANSDLAADACRTDCAAAGCGDGVVDTAEACDDGPANSDTGPDACRTTCALPACGDGVTDTNEMCDDSGDSAECDADCSSAVCGDAYVNLAAGEACDDAGETPDCDPDCSPVDCGDAYVNLAAGETCDSQSTVPHGVCSVGCVVACSGFWENCNGLPGDGCERDLQTDPRHCGVCGFDCGGGACAGGECQPVKIANLSEIPLLSDLAVAGGTLYASTMAGIETVPAGAESVTLTTLLHDSRVMSRTLTIKDNELYFFGVAVPETGATGLHTVNINDGTVASVNTDAPLATGSDGQHLYYVTLGNPATLVRYSYVGGTAEPVGDLPTSTVLAGVDIIVEASVVFSVDLAGGTLWRLNKDPLDPQPTPVTTPDQAIDADSDASHLYWAEPNNNTVFRINKDPFGCLPSPVCSTEPFAVSVARPWALAVDTTHVYWVSKGTASAPIETPRLERRTKAGGSEEVLVPNLGLPPTAIVESGDFVYWVVGDDVTPGALWKLRKAAP